MSLSTPQRMWNNLVYLFHSQWPAGTVTAAWFKACGGEGAFHGCDVQPVYGGAN